MDYLLFWIILRPLISILRQFYDNSCWQSRYFVKAFGEILSPIAFSSVPLGINLYYSDSDSD